MHDHDLDLIAAYAEGDFDELAARLVETCGECRAEYEAQKAVRSWLSGAVPIRLSRDERRRLHTAMRVAVAGGVPRGSVALRPPMWSRAAAVAAALLVVVAGAGAIRAMLGGESEQFREVGAELPADDGVATTTTAAAPETTMAAAAEMARVQMAQGDLGKISREELPSRLDALLDEAESAPPYGGPLEDPQAKALVCSDTLEGVVVRAFTAEVANRAAELYVYRDQAGELQAVALDAESCHSLLP